MDENRHIEKRILRLEGLSVGYHINKRTNREVLSDLNVELRQGELICMLGANGAGKSTLLRTISGVQAPLAGCVKINGRNVNEYGRRELSQLISLVYTDNTAAGGLTLTEVVGLGRQPYTGFFGRLSADDRRVVADSIAAVGLTHKADEYVSCLSDGERQKTMIARALAQQTPIIILDEPTAFLDVASRIETMKLLHDLAINEGKAIILSSHDISQALMLASRLWLISGDGKLIDGVTEDLVLDGALNRLFPDRDVTFDPTIGDFFASTDSHRVVRLVCDDQLLCHWLTNALNRNNIITTDEAEITVEVLDRNKFVVDGKHVAGISSLISELKQHFSE
ncbi:MAG: ABC transporter ATP-binding protein [Muribaculaceae bacterium]|nr:ABC transporter ATP-binding protein [Muribaculaceae bacterium]